MGTITGTIAGFLSTLGIAYVICYIASIGALPLVGGSGMIPPAVLAGFTANSWNLQLEAVLAGVLLNLLSVYIVSSLIWLVGGLIGGLLTRDPIRGVAAGLIAAIFIPILCWILVWYNDYGFVISALVDPALMNQVLNWVINGILAGIIAAVGGVIGGTLTTQREMR